MRIAYADPPYPGCAHLYKDHPDYDGEVDHDDLIEQLVWDYDGFVLHTSSVALAEVLRIFERVAQDDMTDDPFDVTQLRVMAWVKPFAAFKANVPVAYAWEPVLVKAVRKPEVSKRLVLRDWVAEGITMQRGLTGTKPDAVCRWAFEVVGARPDDELVDMYPGTGAVSRAWDAWRSQLSLLSEEAS